jgi:transposase, IS5 family
MALFVRLMVVQQRIGWGGYETLVREVSDSLHLRRFCGLSLTASVPHESTIRKLRRLGPEVIEDITRALIAEARRERRFVARAMRCDSTVVEADIRWPSDAALALDAARRLTRESARVVAATGDRARRVRDRSPAIGRRLRLIGRTVGRRLRSPGGAGQGARAHRSDRRSPRPLDPGGAHAVRPGARSRPQAGPRAAARLDELAERAEKVCRQIARRLAGECESRHTQSP